MLIYFDNKQLHNKIIEIDDKLYSLITIYECNAINKTIYLCDDGYYEICGEKILKYYLNIDRSEDNKIKKIRDDNKNNNMFIYTDNVWEKEETTMLPTNSIKVQKIIETFKIDDSIKFIIERNDEFSIDYYFEYSGDLNSYLHSEDKIITFLSKITNIIDK